MKDRFRQIIENAELPFKEPHTKEILLDELEVVSASEQCEALAVEMMEKFANFIAMKRYIYHPLHDKWKRNDSDAPMTTRELIAKFLSDYTHNSNTQKR